MFKKLSIVALLVLTLALLLDPSRAQKATEEKKQGWLGIYLQELTPELKESMDLEKTAKGILVSGVVEDSPAEEAGIEEGDVIVSFDNKKVYSVDNLTRWVKKSSPGTKVELQVIREGEKKNLEATLGEIPAPTEFEFIPSMPEIEKKIFKWKSFSSLKIGIGIQDLTLQLGEYFGVKDGEGALITEVKKGSPAEESGLRAGDVIVKIDNQPVKNADDVLKGVSDKEKGDKVSFGILRDRRPKELSVAVSEKEEEWSSRMLPGIEKIKRIEILPEKLKIPEFELEKEYLGQERELKKELKELKKELEELKEKLEELKEEMRK